MKTVAISQEHRLLATVVSFKSKVGAIVDGEEEEETQCEALD